MCRHLAYLGPPVTLRSLLTDPPHGLATQSWAPRRQRHGTVNVDGFGVGWYAPGDPEPARYRRAGPVWADPSFADLARVTRSGAVLAAVRSATAGTEPGEAAAAPFAAGRWLFSHNGVLTGWPAAAAGLAAALPPADLHRPAGPVRFRAALGAGPGPADRRGDAGRGARRHAGGPGRAAAERPVQLPAHRRRDGGRHRGRRHALLPGRPGPGAGRLRAGRRRARLGRGARRQPARGHRRRGVSRPARPLARSAGTTEMLTQAAGTSLAAADGRRSY